jgi:hypothetical protein
LVQVAGAIGADYVQDSAPFDVNDVDMYHFHVSGSGQYQITAEVFANRIGSPLDAALSLFRVNADQTLTVLAANADSTNPATTTDGLNSPLYADPVLFAGLTAGDYYLAVSSGFNVPDPIYGLQPGTNGVFDPDTPGLGVNGTTTGDYVLNFLVEPHPETPQVVSVTLAPEAGPPEQLVVQFNEPINVQQLAYEAYQQTFTDNMPAVFVQGDDGSVYFPALATFDSATNEATFQLRDGLPNGSYHFHLSGPLGLTDLAGNPLPGNDPGGDYVSNFTVTGSVYGPPGTPLHFFDNQPTGAVQDLGPLFGHSLQTPFTDGADALTGVEVTRDFSQNSPSTPATGSSASYRFQVLADGYPYAFNVANVSGPGLPDGLTLVLTDAAGKQLLASAPGDTTMGPATLNAGTYTITVAGWSAADAAQVRYDLTITLIGSLERPAPLTIGAAPAIRIRVVAAVAPSSPSVTSPSPLAPVSPLPPAAPSVQGSTPTGILVALGTGPLGLPIGADAGTLRSTLPGLEVLERVVALAPRTLPADEVLQLAALSQTLSLIVGEVDSGLPSSSGADRSSPTEVPFDWAEGLDFLFGTFHPEGQAAQHSRPEPLPWEEGVEPRPTASDQEVDVADTALTLAIGVLCAGLHLEPPERSNADRKMTPRKSFTD